MMWTRGAVFGTAKARSPSRRSRQSASSDYASGKLTTMHLALALAHAAKQQPFNGLYYATCATVIPVLYIALAVQSRAWLGLIRASDAATAGIKGSDPWLRRLRAGAVSNALYITGIVIIISGAYGEESAIGALDSRHAGRVAAYAVSLTTSFLIIAVTMGVLLSWWREEDKGEEQAAGKTSPAPY
jgi:hypothetical protein